MKSLIKKISTVALFAFVISSPVQAARMARMMQTKNITVTVPADGRKYVFADNKGYEKTLNAGENTVSVCTDCGDSMSYRLEFESHNSSDFDKKSTWDASTNTIA